MVANAQPFPFVDAIPVNRVYIADIGAPWEEIIHAYFEEVFHDAKQFWSISRVICKYWSFWKSPSTAHPTANLTPDISIEFSSQGIIQS